MKNTKRRLEPGSLYDHTGIVRALEREAERGWMLEQITGNLGWVYRRIQPQKLKFAVSYCPKASVFDPELTPGQQEFQDFCAHTGWEFVTSCAQLEVYCNRRENPVPIQTDPVLEVESIRRSCRNFQLVYWSLLVLPLLYLLLIWIPSFLRDPVEMLSSSSQLYVLGVETVMLLMSLLELVGYYRWFIRARQAAERGEMLPTASHARLQRVLLGIDLALLIAWLLHLALSGSQMNLTVAVLWGVCMLALMLAVHAVREGLKRLKAPAGINRAITMTLCVLLPIVMMVGLTAYLFHLVRQDVFRPSEQRQWMDQLPLRVEDLMDIEYGEEYNCRRRGDESIFLGRFELYQHAQVRAEHHRELPSLEYTVITVKFPFLYDLCQNNLLEDGRQERLELFGPDWVEIDPTPWGAQAVWELIDMEDDYSWNEFIVCYPDRLIELDFGWSPTPEQMALVGERLGG